MSEEERIPGRMQFLKIVFWLSYCLAKQNEIRGYYKRSEGLWIFKERSKSDKGASGNGSSPRRLMKYSGVGPSQ